MGENVGPKGELPGEAMARIGAMGMERCPDCAGPVEMVNKVPAPWGHPKTPRATLDTLEGIEAEITANMLALDCVGKPLRRLFNGCATCGREPLVPAKMVHDSEAAALGYAYDAQNAKRQAYQEAGEEDSGRASVAAPSPEKGVPRVEEADIINAVAEIGWGCKFGEMPPEMQDRAVAIAKRAFERAASSPESREAQP